MITILFWYPTKRTKKDTFSTYKVKKNLIYKYSNITMKKLWLILFLILTLTACKNKNSIVLEKEQSDLNTLFIADGETIENNPIGEIELTRNDKLNDLKKKLALKWLITKWDMYFDEKEYTTALAQYLKVLRDLPNDKETNLKIWNVYYTLKKFSKAYEYYTKIKDYKSLDKRQAILALINWLYEWSWSLAFINKEIDTFKFSEQEIFYYKNSLICIDNFSKCRANFEEYFKKLEEKQEEIIFKDLATIKETFTNYKNFQLEDLTYKAALVSWWFYKNGFYLISLKTWEDILKENPEYKPVLKIAAKSAYELWNYNLAKDYLLRYNKLETNDVDTSYFLGRVYEKLGEKILASVHFTKALNLWYEDENDIRRRLIFIYYEVNDVNKMLKTFEELMNSKDNKLTINDYNLAIYYNIINDNFDIAKKYSLEWIQKFPDSDLFYAYYAWIMLQEEGLNNEELKNIEENINKALAINNENAMIAMVQGIYNFKIKQFDKAIIAFKNANSLDKSKEYREEINYWLEEVKNNR